MRIPLIRRRNLIADLCWTVLAMIGAFATVADHQFGPGYSFWLGIGFGACGSGLAEMGRSFITSGTKARVQEALRILGGVKD